MKAVVVLLLCLELLCYCNQLMITGARLNQNTSKFLWGTHVCLYFLKDQIMITIASYDEGFFPLSNVAFLHGIMTLSVDIVPWCVHSLRSVVQSKLVVWRLQSPVPAQCLLDLFVRGWGFKSMVIKITYWNHNFLKKKNQWFKWK